MRAVNLKTSKTTVKFCFPMEFYLFDIETNNTLASLDESHYEIPNFASPPVEEPSKDSFPQVAI
jgi:hypothetical protein